MFNGPQRAVMVIIVMVIAIAASIRRLELIFFNIVENFVLLLILSPLVCVL